MCSFLYEPCLSGTFVVGDLAVKLSEKYEKEGKTSAVDMDIVSF